MRAASHSCDDEYIALNTFAILDIITVKNGCTFLHVKQSEKGGTRYMIKEVTGVISKINPLDFRHWKHSAAFQAKPHSRQRRYTYSLNFSEKMPSNELWKINVGGGRSAEAINTTKLNAYTGDKRFCFVLATCWDVDLNIFASIGGGDETFTALTIKGFDNSCHFTRQTNSLMGITRRTIHVRKNNASYIWWQSRFPGG